LLGYKNFSNKQKLAKQHQQLQQQQITQLQKEKQLLAIDAMLKGQEDERSRIAKDLHDGLGGMLSGTKLSFMHMKENLVLTNENAILFDQSLKMLDNTMSDLRKVAHNLMPEALVKFGLQNALKDFCDGIKLASNLGINFQIVGSSRPLSSTADVFIYRIVQELINNCIKHAHAKNLIVQLAYQANTIGITVEDDGIGFDKNNVANNKGAGMQNIQYRVDYFNGTIDIDSTNNKGTSFNIDLKV
jgi:signal transduction histidine kinase